MNSKTLETNFNEGVSEIVKDFSFNFSDLETFERDCKAILLFLESENYPYLTDIYPYETCPIQQYSPFPNQVFAYPQFQSANKNISPNEIEITDSDA